MNNDIKNLFRKVCINQLPSSESIWSQEGLPEMIGPKLIKKPRLYRREDFTRFAKEAFEKGEEYFYTEPINPNSPNGPHKLCEPKYVYELKHSLSEKEFEEFFNNNKISIDSPKGTFIADLDLDPFYPGIHIEFKPNDSDFSIDFAHVDYNTNDDEVNVYVWSNAMTEDYTYKSSLQNIDKFVDYLNDSDIEKDE